MLPPGIVRSHRKRLPPSRQYRGGYYAGARDPVIATLSREGTGYLRMALFGGLSAAWLESGDEARAYLTASAGYWEEEP